MALIALFAPMARSTNRSTRSMVITGRRLLADQRMPVLRSRFSQAKSTALRKLRQYSRAADMAAACVAVGYGTIECAAAVPPHSPRARR